MILEAIILCVTATLVAVFRTTQYCIEEITLNLEDAGLVPFDEDDRADEKLLGKLLQPIHPAEVCCTISMGQKKHLLDLQVILFSIQY